MEVEVYADLLFLLNAGMDALCFCLTGKLLHRPLSALRIAAGAVLGGIYAVASLLFDVGAAVALGLDVAVCLLICLIALGRRSGGWRGFLTATGTYFLLSMVLGGVMTALYHLLNRMNLSAYIPIGDEGPGTWLFALLALVGGGITLWGGRFFRRNAAVQTCRVTLELDGRRVELEGMVDTGNFLRDPLGGRAVICARMDALASILSPELANALRDGRVDGLSSSGDARRLRLIPATTATGGGMLAGFLPDRVDIAYERNGKREMCTVSAVVAVADISQTQSLVPSELIG